MAGLVLEGRVTPFTQLDPKAQDDVLERWRDSSLSTARDLSFCPRSGCWDLLGRPKVLCGGRLSRSAGAGGMMNEQLILGKELDRSIELTADLCIVGSGAGGAVLAARAAEAGRRVVILEAGGLFRKDRFRMLESEAFTDLYQDRGARQTADKAITVLQGRTVGGGTTVNWTTCFRTPESVLDHWRAHHGLKAWTSDILSPHFEAVENASTSNNGQSR